MLLGFVSSTLALGLVLSPVPLAESVLMLELSGSLATIGEPFVPSPSKSRAYRLNVLGRMLGGLTPSKWKRESIANDYRFNAGWETLDAETGKGISGGRYLTTPGTIEEYTAAQYERDFGRRGGGTFRVPISKLAKFVKVVGVVGAVVIAADTGFAVGKYASSLFGMDVEAGLCSPVVDDGGLVAAITGTDCTGYFQMQADFEANFEVVPGWSSASFCGDISGDQYCAIFFGVIDYSIAGANAEWKNTVCLGVTKNGVNSRTNPRMPNPYQYRVYEIVDGVPVQMSSGRSTTSSGVNLACADAFGGTQYLYSHWGYSGTRDFSGIAIVNAYGTVQPKPVLGGADPSGVSFSDGNPDRYLTCSITGNDGITYTLDTPVFKETDGSIPQPECPILPDGVVALNVSVDENGGGQSNNWYNEATTPEYQQWLLNYPECRTGSCKLDLLVLGTSAPSSCFDVAEVCADWFVDPEKATNYQCKYGMNTVALEECYVYEGVFKPDRIAVGAPYSDPMTGEWSGGQSAATPDQLALGQPVQSPDAIRVCTGLASAGFDPVAWVMRPIQCALEWAFVPRVSVINLQGASVMGAWDDTVFGQVGLILAPFGAIPIATGCTGWPVDLVNTWPVPWEWHLVLGAGCSGPIAVLAGVIRTISGGLLALGGLLAVSSYLGVPLGFRGFGRGGGHE